jgi:hypothetical protein
MERLVHLAPRVPDRAARQPEVRDLAGGRAPVDRVVRHAEPRGELAGIQHFGLFGRVAATLCGGSSGGAVAGR